jgi:hypothetical protein
MKGMCLDGDAERKDGNLRNSQEPLVDVVPALQTTRESGKKKSIEG